MQIIKKFFQRFWIGKKKHEISKETSTSRLPNLYIDPRAESLKALPIELWGLKDIFKDRSYVHRAVYIFFLLRKEGVLLKELSLYKQELLDIYIKVSNRGSVDAMRKTVDDLVNPFSNSMNEKCSRIRETFLKEMDERVARYYVIDGERGKPKRIALDRSLVVFEEGVAAQGISLCE